MDFSKLSDQQIEIATKVAKEAERQGINPDFVLAMVMQESQFDQGAKSNKGAIGVMQLMPKTAAGLGVDPYDVDENIKGGISYIKQLVKNKNIGNDPIKVLMGYNAGPGTPFLKSGDVKDLPEETIDHVFKVTDFSGGNLPTVTFGQDDLPKDDEEKKAEAEDTVAAQADEGERLGSSRTADIPGEAEQTRKALGVIGGVAGTGTTAAIETTKKLAPLVPNLINQMTGQGVNPAKPVTRASLQRYLNSQLAENLRLPLSELEKVTGGQKIRTMSEVQTALKALQEVKSERVAKETTGMRRPIYTTTPGRPAVDLSKYETKPAGPVRQAVRRELQTAGDVVKSVLPSVGRVGIGGLGAANAMMQGYDAWEMAQKLKAMNDPSWVDYARLATKTMATVGGGLSMLPFAPTQAAGLALQAPEMGIEAYEFFKNRPRGGLPADEKMTVDAMGNPVQ